MATEARVSARVLTLAAGAMRLCTAMAVMGVLGACADGHTARAIDQRHLRVPDAPSNAVQATAHQTNRPLDVMIQGDGYFPVVVDDSLGMSGIAYTRMGSFKLTRDGDLVMASQPAARLEPAIQISPEVVEVSIDSGGLVSCTFAGKGEPVVAGQMQIVTFAHPAGLKRVGDGLYVETAASGAPEVGDPGTDRRGTILQNYLESSNVDRTRELIDLIRAQLVCDMERQLADAAD